MADLPEIEKTPTSDTSVNEPESGTYGEKADLNRLRQSLPPMGPPPGAPGAAKPIPTPGPGTSPTSRPGRPPEGPPGVPAALMAPSSRPGVPLSQPPRPAGPIRPPRAQAADQQRLMILDALTTHPDVSEETREWAKRVRDALIEGRR